MAEVRPQCEIEPAIRETLPRNADASDVVRRLGSCSGVVTEIGTLPVLRGTTYEVADVRDYRFCEAHATDYRNTRGLAGVRALLNQQPHDEPKWTPVAPGVS